MADPNVEVVRGLFRAFDEEDYAAALRLFHPEVEWNPSEGAYRGLEGLAQAMVEWLEPWDEHDVVGEGFVAAGETVVAEVHLSARGKGSGMQIDQRFFQVYRFENGQIKRMDEYLSRAEAVAAAGLDAPA